MLAAKPNQVLLKRTLRDPMTMRHAEDLKQDFFPTKPLSAPVGPVHRRYGKLQLLAEKISMACMQSIVFPSRLRPPLLRLFGAKVGRNVRIAQKVFIGQPSNLTIEADVVINIGTFIDCSAPVYLGEKVRLGYQCMIVTGSHNAENSVFRRKEGNHVRRPVTIERGCWIQSRSMVGPGVTMAEGCTLLASATLTKNTIPNGEYCGLPATRKRDLATTDDYKWPHLQGTLEELLKKSALIADAAIPET